jgi:hypothetical protein
LARQFTLGGDKPALRWRGQFKRNKGAHSGSSLSRHPAYHGRRREGGRL